MCVLVYVCERVGVLWGGEFFYRVIVFERVIIIIFFCIYCGISFGI